MKHYLYFRKHVSNCQDDLFRYISDNATFDVLSYFLEKYPLIRTFSKNKTDTRYTFQIDGVRYLECLKIDNGKKYQLDFIDLTYDINSATTIVLEFGRDGLDSIRTVLPYYPNETRTAYSYLGYKGPSIIWWPVKSVTFLHDFGDYVDILKLKAFDELIYLYHMMEP